MLRVTDTGITIDTLADIHARLADGFRRIYGDDIRIDSDTPDGQMIGLFAQELANIDQVLAFITQMLDPYQATGAWLEQRAMYAGIARRGAQYSRLPEVILTGMSGVVVPAGTVFSDEARGRWVLEADAVLNEVGSVRTPLRSELRGRFSLPANASLKLETVIVGIDRVVSTTAATEGVEEETDGQLLLRFMSSHSVNNHDDREGLRAALLSLQDVEQAEVLENYNHDTDPVTGVPGHSINAIVIGGKDEDIATTLLKKKIGGCGMTGAQHVRVRVADAIREARFDRAVMRHFKVSLTIGRMENFHDIDKAQVQSAIAAATFRIGEPVYATRLICHANKVPGFFVHAITVDGGEKVDIGIREYATISPSDVEVLIG